MDTKESYLLPVAGQKTPFLPSPSSQPFRGYLVLQLSKEQKAVRARLLRSWQAPPKRDAQKNALGALPAPSGPGPRPPQVSAAPGRVPPSWARLLYVRGPAGACLTRCCPRLGPIRAAPGGPCHASPLLPRGAQLDAGQSPRSGRAGGGEPGSVWFLHAGLGPATLGCSKSLAPGWLASGLCQTRRNLFSFHPVSLAWASLSGSPKRLWVSCRGGRGSLGFSRGGS